MPNISSNAVAVVLEDLRRRSKHAEYFDNPVLWAEEVLGVEPWSMQRDMMMSVVNNKRTAVKSCHSSGKTWTMGVLACWWVSTRGSQSLVVSTAPSYHQVHAILWNEIRKQWSRKDLMGDVTQSDQWNLITKRKDGKENRELVAFGRKPPDHDLSSFQGLHRENGVLFLIDEAVGVSEAIMVAAEVNTTADIDRIFAIANPDDVQTAFGKIFKDDMPTWNKLTISAYDTPNFTGEPVPGAVAKNLPSKTFVEEMKVQWGEDSSRFKSKILAEFPDESDAMFFTQKDVDKATDFEPTVMREREPVRPHLGVDIARMGEDKSTVYTYDGVLLAHLDSWGKADLVETYERIKSLAIRSDAEELRIDSAGIGAGVYDMLMNDLSFPHHRCTVFQMLGGAKATDPFAHFNGRAERHDELKKLIRQEKVKIDPEDENSEQLIKEMLDIKYELTPKGAIQIEGKADMRKRGAKSPDHLDAATYACADLTEFLGLQPGDTMTVETEAFVGEYGIPELDALDW